MSGIEVAGLVLGSIPILLAALKLGGEALGSSRRLIGHKAVIERYQTILEAEATTFQNTLILLLADVVSNLKLQTLLEDPLGPAWRDESFVTALRDKRFGDDYDVILKVMKLMDETLRKFGEKIGKEAAQRQQRKRILLRVITSQTALDEFVQDLGDHNRRLETLTRQAASLQTTAKSGKYLSRLEKFRKQAMSFFMAVQASLTCMCRNHEAGLVLNHSEQFNTEPLQILFNRSGTSCSAIEKDWTAIAADILPEPSPTVSTVTSQTHRVVGKGKQVAFQTSVSWSTSAWIGASSTVTQTMPIALPQPSAQTSLQSITDVCTLLNGAQGQTLPETLGSISNQGRHFRIMKSTSIVACTSSNPPSLKTWIADASRAHLSFHDQMHIAVSFSAAVLSLSQTPWLPNYPSADLLLLLKSDLSVPAKVCIVSDLRPGNPQGDPGPAPAFVKFPVFFYLGIYLIELIMGESIEQLHTLAGYQPGSQCSKWEELFGIADGLLQKNHILHRGGLNYEAAVRSCIRGDFGDPGLNSKTSIEDKDLRQSVYRSVILPLHENIPRWDAKRAV